MMSQGITPAVSGTKRTTGSKGERSATRDSKRSRSNEKDAPLTSQVVNSTAEALKIGKNIIVKIGKEKFKLNEQEDRPSRLETSGKERKVEKQKGKGVILYKEFTPANKWIRQPDHLTSSEWRLALKMTANVCPLRAIPGRSRDGNHCRRCVSEIETLGHVLGACPFSETLRNSRHQRIRSMIAEALRKKGLTVREEVHDISQEGSCRRIDMLAIPLGSTSAYIIDPTVRFEAQEQQPTEVHSEKCRIYEPTVPFYLEKYHLTPIEVVGLMVGARGTIPRLFVSFCKKFQLNNDFIRDVSLAAIRRSLAILKYHLYFVS
ncbi:hypothetical protein ANN_13951 [Periplaneta americana]|uniref:Reverse transcriptase n=1 Tax=Periplaneta americana TaxID=6978 RepID=A0ABQ8SV16_PERAM|nr:hypothetical protein ANN_13951 [Periplaneta americana]